MWDKPDVGQACPQACSVQNVDTSRATLFRNRDRSLSFLGGMWVSILASSDGRCPLGKLGISAGEGSFFFCSSSAALRAGCEELETL